MNITKKINVKTFVAILCSLLILALLMPVIANKEGSAAGYEQPTLFYGISGDSNGEKISHAKAKSYSCNANWISVTTPYNSKGDTYIITVASAKNISNADGYRTASVTLYDSTGSNRQVVKKYWIRQTVNKKSTLKFLRLNKHKTVVAVNDSARLTVDATGDGLTYEWWYQNPGKGNVRSSKYQGYEYKCKMIPEKDGQRVYCIIRDKYGNSYKTDPVILRTKKTLKVTSFNKEKLGAVYNDSARLTIDATGDGLTYEWWYKNPGKAWIKSGMYQDNYYQCKMMPEKNGQLVYCYVKDKYGNDYTSETVTLKLTSNITITKAPKNTTAEINKIATVSCAAKGTVLSYQWQEYSNSSKTWSDTKQITDTYMRKMTTSVNGLKIRCKITDKYGMVKYTDPVTLKSKAIITRQPTNQYAPNGSKFSLRVSATGNGLKYKWQKKTSLGWSDLVGSANTSPNVYEATMNKNLNNSKIRCKITDSNNNTIYTNEVILNNTIKLNIKDNGNKTFDLRANGDYMGTQGTLLACRDNKYTYLSLYIDANNSWALNSSADYVYLGLASDVVESFEAAKLSQYNLTSINGSAGKHHILIRAKQNTGLERSCTLTFKSGNVTEKYTINQYYIEGIEKYRKSLDSAAKKSEWYNLVKDVDKDYFTGKKLTNGIKTNKCVGTNNSDIYYAVETYIDPSTQALKCNYIFFNIDIHLLSNAPKDGIEIEPLYAKGMTISNHLNKPVIRINGVKTLAGIGVNSVDLEAQRLKEELGFIKNICTLNYGALNKLFKIDDVQICNTTLGKTSSALSFVFDLASNAYLEKIDDSNKYTLNGINGIDVYLPTENVLRKKGNKIELYAFNDYKYGQYTVNLNIKSSETGSTKLFTDSFKSKPSENYS